MRLFLIFSICKNVNSFISSIYLRIFFIFLHPLCGKINLTSEIIDLNGDSSYVILSYFFKISNNSSFFTVFFSLLYLSYLQLTSFYALINLPHVMGPFLLIRKKKYKKNIYKKIKNIFLLYSSKKTS